MADLAKEVDLRALRVRPVRDAEEGVAWDRLMETHYYLGFRSPFGATLRPVVKLPDESWAALLDWVPEQQFRCLHLIASNACFLVLSGFRAANLASRVLGLSLNRLSSDMEALRGHPVLLAETFVDPSRFRGACYQAAGWTGLGESASWGCVEVEPPKAERLGSLYEFLRGVPEFR